MQDYVYVLSKEGCPLMPTRRFGWVRRALRDGRAHVMRRCPFTIQLDYDSSTYTQDVTLGVDAGSKHIGVSATTENRELFRAEVEQRTDVKKNVEARAQMRRGRRSRKLRHRKARFQNRRRPEGWIPPTSVSKVRCHLSAVNMAMGILPISRIRVETGQFDPHKLKDPKVSRRGYQEGPLKGWAENVKAYVRNRDGYTCRVCGSTQDIEVHHVRFKSHGGTDTPENLVCLCHGCHHKLHQGHLSERELSKLDRAPVSLKDATWMNLVRPKVIEELKRLYPGIPVETTYGYETALIRREAGIPKSHGADALCITGNIHATPCTTQLRMRKIRCHNRQLHKANPSKGGIRRRNQCPHEVFSFHRFDKVRVLGQECFIWGLRSSGSFLYKTLDGTKVAERTYKIAKHLESPKGFICQMSPIT